MTDKIKISKKDFEELYEVEEDLTQPKIEDNIDEPESVLTDDEEIANKEFHQDDIIEEVL